MVDFSAAVEVEDAWVCVCIFIVPAAALGDCHVGPWVALGERSIVGGVHRLKNVGVFVQGDSVTALHIHIRDHFLVINFFHLDFVSLCVFWCLGYERFEYLERLWLCSNPLSAIEILVLAVVVRVLM